MQRTAKLLLFSATLLVIAAGTGVWLVWFPPWAVPLEKNLLGAWQGTGRVSGESSIEFKPDPAHGIAGGRSSDTTTSVCTVQAEFKPDGTYTWCEQSRGDGSSKGMNIDVSIPSNGGEPARWEVVRAQGNKLTVRILFGEVIFDFQGKNAFTMDIPESTKSTGTIAFLRSAPSKQ